MSAWEATALRLLTLAHVTLWATSLWVGAVTSPAMAQSEPQQPPTAPERAPEIPQSGQRPSLSTIGYVLDEIRVMGNQKTAASLISALVGLEPGQRFGLVDLERVRLQLLGTGFFVEVDACLEKGSERGHVVLLIEVTERNTILLSDFFLGSSREHSFWGGVDLSEGNLLGRGLNLRAAVVASDRQWATQLSLSDPYAFALPMRLGGFGHFSQGRETLFIADPARLDPGSREPLGLRYDRAGGELSVGLYPLTLLGVFLNLGAESVKATSELPQETQKLILNGRSLHTTLRMTFDHDTRDNPFFPTRGYQLNLSIQGSSSLWGSDYDYVKTVLRSAYALRPGFNEAGHVIRFNLFGGVVLGDAPFYERFYVGDVSALVPSRDLGLNFASTASPDFFKQGADNLSYETAVAGAGVEYGVPLLSSGDGNALFYRVEFFLGVGVFGMTTLDDPPGERDVGLGVDLISQRQGNAFPFDLSFDLGFRAETPIGIFGLSFANGLALVPF